MVEETSLLVTSKAQTFHWTDYGLKIHIPEGALPAGLEQCRLNIKVAVSGEFEFAQNTYLMSAVYWINSEPRCKFSNHLTMEIQHCAKSTQIARLSFVRATRSQKDLPYTFTSFKQGVFTSSSPYGCINLDHFCGIAITQDGGTKDRQYCASLYYLGVDVRREIHLVVTWNLSAHLTVGKVHTSI